MKNEKYYIRSNSNYPVNPLHNNGISLHNAYIQHQGGFTQLAISLINISEHYWVTPILLTREFPKMKTLTSQQAYELAMRQGDKFTKEIAEQELELEKYFQFVEWRNNPRFGDVIYTPAIYITKRIFTPKTAELGFYPFGSFTTPENGELAVKMLIQEAIPAITKRIEGIIKQQELFEEIPQMTLIQGQTDTERRNK